MWTSISQVRDLVFAFKRTLSEIGCRRRANPNLEFGHAGVEAGPGRTPIATAAATRLLEEMASSMYIEVDREEVDPALCTRANGWKTAGEKLKKSAEPPGTRGEVVKATPDVIGDAICSFMRGADGAGRTKRPPIHKGRLLKKSRMPELPRDDMKIVVRPRGGALPQVAAEEAREDVICPNGHKNFLVISTPQRDKADRYAVVERIDVRGTAYEVSTYEAAPHGTVKSVIRGIPLEDRPWTSKSKSYRAITPRHYKKIASGDLGRWSSRLRESPKILQQWQRASTA
ncbi:hypothetical protein HPB48_025087 [Haemaphysalis longicornis]|uniref:Uncharacterized protein n=1 Tax=Haemaphysalis longicornis TaxID=44386 RepID=A0A9J6H772_HAELO|nr:hypothetical protein HPB48_025087 [Haemaphysalis longicornis]